MAKRREVEESVERWTEVLCTLVETGKLASIRQVIVVDEAVSTQDEVRERLRAGSREGLLVVALRQTGGRGRFGRPWQDTGEQGVAVSLALPGEFARDGTLSIAMGVALCRTAETALDVSPPPTGSESLTWALLQVFMGWWSLLFGPDIWNNSATIGLRWPNDLVTGGTGNKSGRKVGGVLIEMESTIAIAGIGMNVHQHDDAWPAELRGEATSLSALGSKATRLQVIASLLSHIDQTLSLAPDALAREWRRRDVLKGTIQTFRSDGEEYTGLVKGIEPTSEIRLQLGRDEEVVLRADVTTLLREETGVAR